MPASMVRLSPAARAASRAAVRELLGMLIGPLPGLPAPAVLCDRSPDPGLFGPASLTWRLAREPLLLLGGGRALLMQVAHPLVGQGVVDHSAYAEHPFDRLLETVRWLVLVIFGTAAEAERAIQDLQRIHARVRGRLAPDNATGHFPAGTPYAATDPALARWVLATIVESLLAGRAALIGPLPEEAQDRFVREWCVVGERMGIASAALWPNAAALRAYVADELASERVTPVPASALAARPVLRPPLPWPGLQPVSAFIGFLTAGLLPPALRAGYGIAWGRPQQWLFATICVASRALHPWLPRRLRVSPLHDLARRRCTRRVATGSQRLVAASAGSRTGGLQDFVADADRLVHLERPH